MSIETFLGDDLLRRDLHRDRAQGHAHHLLKGYEDQGEAGSADALEASEQEHDAAFILPQHANRAGEIEDDRNADNEGPLHASISHIRPPRSSRPVPPSFAGPRGMVAGAAFAGSENAQ
jgi:hypothetical protein